MFAYVYYFLLFVLLFFPDGHQTPGDAVAGIMVAALLMVRVSQSTNNRWTNVLAVGVGGYVAVSVASTVFSMDLGLSVYRFGRVFLAVAAAWIGGSFTNKEKGVFINALPAYALLVLGTAFLYLVLKKPGAAIFEGSLLTSWFGHHHVSDLLAPGAVLSLWFYHTEDKKKNHHLFILLSTIIGIVSLTARSALFVTGLGLFVMAYLSPKKMRRMSLLLGTMLAGVALLGVFIQNTSGFPWNRDQGSSKTAGLAARISYIQQATHPRGVALYLGTGPNTYILHSLKNRNSVSDMTWFSHSFWFDVFIEIGTFGLLSMVIIVAMVGRVYLKNKNDAIDYRAGAALAAIVIAMVSLFDYTLHLLPLWILWWALVGMACSRTDDEEDVKTSSLVPHTLITILMCVSAAQVLVIYSPLPLFSSVSVLRTKEAIDRLSTTPPTSSAPANISPTSGFIYKNSNSLPATDILYQACLFVFPKDDEKTECDSLPTEPSFQSGALPDLLHVSRMTNAPLSTRRATAAALLGIYIHEHAPEKTTRFFRTALALSPHDPTYMMVYRSVALLTRDPTLLAHSRDACNTTTLFQSSCEKAESIYSWEKLFHHLYAGME